MTTAELDESMGMHACLSGRSSVDLDSLAGSSPHELSWRGDVLPHMQNPHTHHRALSSRDLQNHKPLPPIPSDDDLEMEENPEETRNGLQTSAGGLYGPVVQTGLSPQPLQQLGSQ